MNLFSYGLPKYLRQGNDDTGNNGGETFAELQANAQPTSEQLTAATDYLSKNTQNWDAKTIEGKKPGEVYGMARAREQEILKADIWRGTPWQGTKVPDKFVIDKDGKKSVNASELVKSYGELERRQFTRKEDMRKEIEAELNQTRMKDRPESPDKYEFEKFKLKDGTDVGLDDKDPVAAWFRNTAWDMGLSQKQFNDIAKGYMQQEMLRGPKWDDEAKTLGGSEQADMRLKRIDGFMRGNAPQEVYDAFASIPATASMTKLFEHIMELAGEPAWQPVEGGGFVENLTRQDIQKLQNSPEYRRGDPVTLKKVQAGFRQLAKGT